MSDTRHQWVNCDDHVYCWECGMGEHARDTPCIPDGRAPKLYKWADGSYRGAPEPSL